MYTAHWQTLKLESDITPIIKKGEHIPITLFSVQK